MRTLLLLLAALAACTGHDDLLFPEVQDPSPFQGQTDGPIATDTQLDTVALGRPVTLRWTVPGATAVAWALEVPAGSAAFLDDPSAAMPSFTPDVPGTYRVVATAMGPAGSDSAERRLTAAAYAGAASCTFCHGAQESAVRMSEHGQTVVDHGSVLFATPGCTTCHVLNPVPPPATPVPGSFDDEAARAGFDPATYTTFSAFAAAFPTVADRASVSCESCHGPGSAHGSDPRRIAVTLRAGLCGVCHDGTVGPDRIGQWTGSAHGKPPPAATIANESCRKCHTALGFVKDLAGLAPDGVQGGAPGVSCAACHHPHSGANAAQVRLFGTVPVTSGGSYNGGRAATCLVCHQSDVADPAAHATAGNPFPCAVQTDMLATKGVIGDSRAFGSSFHASTVFRLRSFTGDPDDSDTPDSCVICHMAPGGGVLGEHTWKLQQGAVELATGNCDRCHPGLATFDFEIGRDFDGDGLKRGVQTEIRGLIEILHSALRAADPGGGLSRPGSGAPIDVSADLSRTTPALRQAVYNYNFVVTDGSLGIHNTTFAVQILQRTYERVTGVPFGTAFPRADLR